MAEKLLLINPTKPPSKRRTAKKRAPKPLANRRKKLMASPTKKRRTAAQKRATARMVAANRARRRKTPTVARRRRRPAVSYTAAAPARRRRPARRPNPIVRRRRRNPIQRKGILDNLVFPAVTAAGGALALDVAWAYLPVPASVKTGAIRHVAKAAGAVALSYGAGMLVSKKTANQIGMGALTTVFYQAARDFMSANVPGLRMDGMGYYSPAMVPARGQVPGQQAMGYYPPMPQAQPTLNESEATFVY